MSNDFVKNFSITKEAGSQIKVAGEIPETELAKHRSAALKKLGENVKADGFRPGHLPESVLVSKIGELNIMTEMAERALASVYPHILSEHKIDAIGHPQIEITKIAAGDPLGFIITISVMPEITLPNYKATAQELNKNKTEVLVTDEDVDKQIQDILRQKAAYERLQKKAADGVKETHTHDDGTVHEGPAHDDEGKPIENIEDLPIPELTDDLVKTLGTPGQFETVDDFKAKLREHLAIEKTRDAAALHRATLTDKIIADSTFELPQIMIDGELNQMFAQMDEDIKRAGLKMDDYLTHIKKDREDLKKEWTPAAEKRARLQLVLNEIAKQEKIEPEKEKLEEEVKNLLEHYKDADQNRVRIYVASVLQNEAVMKFLESQ
ncbi:hypothetical protein A2837_02825 [Candidatus Kaiserbacteria bacterium RIFCSPHIGHO2_01_FULL_46_22]|uniref:Trigger factor n=1 Tax=Candidatus Kaiserbacteria bacterium RIFCSPHIGHO2_01_FULL_46_22 TaxID=1798475 RepID=A0A1F6BWW9_9BACT|nr:MAG: hypothetical protein A2837_02825 [Candidatus Kaiserbacteria bacterium RIFCSPHIGHO2_01_FULL_46_22]